MIFLRLPAKVRTLDPNLHNRVSQTVVIELVDAEIIVVVVVIGVVVVVEVIGVVVLVVVIGVLVVLEVIGVEVKLVVEIFVVVGMNSHSSNVLFQILGSGQKWQ